MDLDFGQCHQIPTNAADLRLEQSRVWRRIRSICASDHRIPNQLSVLVSIYPPSLPIALIPYRYFFIHNLATDDEDIIRHAALLRGTESAWQAVSYGLTSIPLFAQVGGVYFNFLLWGISLYPAWLVLRRFGTEDSRVEVSTSSPGSTSDHEAALKIA